MEKKFKILFVIAIMSTCIGSSASNGKKGNPNNHYWEWGWGTYLHIGEPLDAARFDWSIIALGNICENRALERANEILKINPDHKFLLRVWPIGNLGQSSRNHYYMTMFDYFYRDGVKEKMLESTKTQVELFMKGLSKSENLAGICFLEEIPHHISSDPFLRWRKGEPLPWDIEAYGKEIQKELGEPFDMMNPKHRLWWGKKYVQMLDDIHKTIKEASGGKRVIYWHQSAMIGTLDELQPGEPMIRSTGQSPVPVFYKDIVKPGFCDGIFGYPGNKVALKKRCTDPAEKIGCIYFTQLSVPAFMRTGSWEDSIKGARNNDPRNLGTFFHIENYHGRGAWNMVPWHRRDNKDKFDTSVADYRKVASLYSIGEKFLDQNLKPEVKFDYNVKDIKQGSFAQIFVQIFNPISPSWYGGDMTKSTIRNLSVKLEIPEGFELPPENNPPEHIELGNLKPYECIVSDWWIRKNTDEAMPENPTFKAVVKWGDGKELIVKVLGSDVEIPSLQTHCIRGNEEKWVEPAYRLPSFTPAVIITPLGKKLVSPELISGNYAIKYDGTINSNEELIVRGDKAEIKYSNLFSPEISQFRCKNPEGAAFSEGFAVYETPRVVVEDGKKYLLKLTGMAKDGGNTAVNVIFFCGKEMKVIPNVFAGKFTEKMQTLATEISVPEFADKGKIFVKFCFYRFDRKGIVIYKNFSFAQKEDIKRDVSSKLQGTLRPLEKNVTIWQFKDKSINYWGKKGAIKFFNPAEEKSAEVENLPYF